MVQLAFRVCGPLEARIDGRRVELAGRRERALLGVLLLNAGTVVSIEQLIDGVWGDPAPRSARHMVHEYVLRVRVALGDATLISTRAPGYTVALAAGELDAGRFTELVQAARRARDATRSEDALRWFDEALGLWRGDALCDVALEGNARAAAGSLDDQRRTVAAERVDVALALGRQHELIPDLERAVAAEPLDERVRGQLMLALYRDGRQSEALERYRAGRRRLVDEVGVEPGSDLRALEQAILRQDPALALEAPAEGRESSTPHEPADAPPAARRRSGIAAAAVAVAVAAVGVIVAIAATRGPDAVAPAGGDAVAIVDATHARLLGSIPIGSRPGAIAFASGSVWVADLDSSSLSRISPASRRVIGTVPLAVAAQSLAVAGGRVWTVGAGPMDIRLTVERINPTFDSASRVTRVQMVSAGDSGSLAARGETVFVAPRSGLLTRIDARDGRTLGQSDINAAPNAVAIGFASTWLAYREADVLLRRGADGTTTIPVGRGPSAVAVGEHAVWVADALDDTVKAIDPATSSVITTIPVGSDPSAIAIGGDSVWVANGGDGTLMRIDPRRYVVDAKVQVGGSPQALVVADGKVWVSVQAPPPAQPSGGTAVVSVPSFVKEFDPALAGTYDAAQIEYATCALLLNNPDEPGAAGMRLVPDAARALPTVSADGRTYTFAIRPGMRFSPPSNQPVTAQTFKYAIERSMSPRMGQNSQGEDILGDVVGVRAYVAKKARHVTGVQARGDRLTIRLAQPAPDLPTRIASTAFCAVPTDMPLKPARGAIPSAGPYYIASQTPKRGLVLLRNPNYHGDRPRRLDRIEVIIGASKPVAGVEAGRIDYALDGVPAAQDARLRRLYGAGSVAARRGMQRYFVHRRIEVDSVELNEKRPLFASRRMRRAVNYAVDRRALAAHGGTWYAAAEPADMYLPPGIPGFRETHAYPLVPDVATARRLAGSARHTAVLYCMRQGGGPRAAQIVKRNLAAIGIDVRVRCMPGDQFWPRILLRPDEPWDMAIDGWFGLNDPADFLDSLKEYGVTNPSHFHDPRYSRMLRAARRLSGPSRAAAYARIDDLLVRDAAPSIAFANESTHDFLSARMGCQLFQPVVGIDLAALCVRPNG